MRRSTREAIRDIFTLHRGEANAFRWMALALLVLAVWVTCEQWFRRPDPAEWSAEHRALQDWLAGQESTIGEVPAGVELVRFDPNGLSVQQWMALGLTERQARSVLSYEAKGGPFLSKADLARLRAVPPELFQRWEPFIELPDSLPGKSDTRGRERWSHDRTARATGNERVHEPMEERKATRRMVEMNSADSAELAALPGLGPSLARAILRYRDLLGGYSTVDQVQEVKLLQAHPGNFALFSDRLVVDTLLVRRIAVNRCTPDELAGHPYVNWKIAKALVAYRTHHGPFADPAAIKRCKLITDSLFRKLAPYLSTE